MTKCNRPRCLNVSIGNFRFADITGNDGIELCIDHALRDVRAIVTTLVNDRDFMNQYRADCELIGAALRVGAKHNA